MTAKTTASTAGRHQASAEPSRPTHRLYPVTGDGDASIWTPIGAAWPNNDGKGFNLNCDTVPLTGRIALDRAAPRDRMTRPSSAAGSGPPRNRAVPAGCFNR
ncbi:MAG: hypothetical protein JO127_19865 [Caulobacteraceae bacterium]|nr:hypothetical protein [Caulobacteraceae bacterium]